jgi:hypothetical protein
MKSPSDAPIGEFGAQLGVIDRLAREQFHQLPAPAAVNLQSLIRKPQPTAHEHFASDIANTLGATEATAFEDQPIQARIAGRIAGTLVVAKIIDRTKIKTLGQKAPTCISNALIGRVIGASAFEFMGTHYAVFDDEAARQTEQFSDVAAQLIEQESPFAWYAPKIALASHALRTARNFFRWAEEASEGAPESAVEQQGRDNDSLFAATKAIQRYGVKSAIAPAIGEHRVDEWLFIPTDEFLADPDTGDTTDNRTNSGLGFLLRDCEAVVIGTSGRFITSRPKPIQQQTSDKETSMIGYESVGLIDPNASDPRSIMPLVLTKDGQLATLHGVDLRGVFAQHRANEAYELLRSEILAIHFDLVTPALIHSIVEGELKTPPASGGDTTPRMGKLRELIVARRRVINILGEDIDELFDEEEKQHKDMVVHGVINHIRDLPEGYRASQEARDRCFREIGIILPETGQTYVRKHNRGNIQETEPKGHRTTHRNSGVVRPGRRQAGRTTAKGTRQQPKRAKRRS